MKIGSLEIRADFDLRDKTEAGVLFCPSVKLRVSRPDFRWLFGVDKVASAEYCRGKWFDTCLAPIDDLQVGPRWFVWRMGIARLHWWFGFRVEKTATREVA